ncbi:MAG: protein kinase [Verrucomicrobia bacterium]|nr:protein kinase [Verrucomicrobiota bacterium]
MGKPDSKPSPALFISHSHEDEAIAEAACAALESAGFPCWIAPRDVRGGRPYSGQITQAIREARLLILIFSQAANRSKHVLREVERAAHCQTELLTFRIEQVTPSDDLAYFLGADHWVDGFRPLPPSQHFTTLIEHARGLLQENAESDQADQLEEAAVDQFAHFRIERRPDGSFFKLGKGGMGVTYKAVDTILNRPVALKVIAAEQLNSPQAKHRFLREAQAAALIHHPHVATIFQFGEEGDAYFYAMEFVEGEDLDRYVARQGPLSPAATLRVMSQIAQALEAAQARRLIHRDIKPANIMAVANRTGALDVKLIDFGLAKGAGAEGLDPTNVTRTVDFVGSPAFASPEQCETKKLDIRSDIYSLGVTAWYLLSGKRPFVGTVGEVMVAQIIKPPPFDQLAAVPEPVIALLRKMLGKKPEDRFQTPDELEEAVEKTVAQLSTQPGLPGEKIAVQPDLEEAQLPSGEGQPGGFAAIDSPLFAGYLAPEVGMLIGNRYRLLAEEREGNGGRLFLACDEQDHSAQPSKLALKLLHPEIAADPSLVDLLENEVGVIQQGSHPGLVSYLKLERSEQGVYLLRDWVHGFLLYDLLRWRRSLKASELPLLLEPLAGTLDFAAGRGLGLVDVSVHKILLACPKEIEDFEALAKSNPQGWSRCTLKLNPLSLAPLLFRTRNGWDRRTIVPASNVLSMTQAGAGIQGTKAVRLHGRLLYELLSGRPPERSDGQTIAYKALPELDQTGNEILRRALIASDSREAYKSCSEFWNAFKENIVAGGHEARAATSSVEPPQSEKSPNARPSSVIPSETRQSTRKSETEQAVVPSSEFPTQAPVIPGTQTGKQQEKKGKRLLTVLGALIIGVIAAIALIVYMVWDQMTNGFSGADQIVELLNSASNLTGDEFEAVSTTAANLKDWFFLKSDMRWFAVPKEFANAPTLGTRVFKFKGADVGQILARDDREVLMFFFRPADLGVKIRTGKWAIVDDANWEGAVTAVDDCCFIVAFKGTHSDMRAYLDQKLSRSTATITPSPTSTVAVVSPTATVTATPEPSVSISPSPNTLTQTPSPQVTPSPVPSPTEPSTLILRLLAAMQAHDYSTFLPYTLDKETNYFGHKNASSSYIQKDMEQDARTYASCRFSADVRTFRTALEQDLRHDSIEFDSEAKEVSGKQHKARCRLDIYYAPSLSPKLQSITLKVLPR